MKIHPDFVLPSYFHTTSIESRQGAIPVAGLISKCGLLSESEQHGLGNISGDLSWSLEYGTEYKYFLLTVWSNNFGFLKNDAYTGTTEYGVHNRVKKEERLQIEKEVEMLLRQDPQNLFVRKFLYKLRFFQNLLPSAELKFILFGNQTDRKIFIQIWKEIENGKDRLGPNDLYREHQVCLTQWFSENMRDKLLYIKSDFSASEIPANLLRDLNINCSVGQLCDLYLCSHPQEEFDFAYREYRANFSWSRLINYHLPLEPNNNFLLAQMALAKKRLLSVGIDPEGSSHGIERK